MALNAWWRIVVFPWYLLAPGHRDSYLGSDDSDALWSMPKQMIVRIYEDLASTLKP